MALPQRSGSHRECRRQRLVWLAAHGKKSDTRPRANPADAVTNPQSWSSKWLLFGDTFPICAWCPRKYGGLSGRLYTWKSSGCANTSRIGILLSILIFAISYASHTHARAYMYACKHMPTLLWNVYTAKLWSVTDFPRSPRGKCWRCEHQLGFNHLI